MPVEPSSAGSTTRRTASAVLCSPGPPNFKPRYRSFVDDGDAGSPKVEPVFRRGRIVRFTTSPGQPVPPVGKPWNGTRVLYLQHTCDPITWWSTDLILHRPAWLTEPRGGDAHKAAQLKAIVRGPHRAVLRDAGQVTPDRQ